MEKGRNLGTVLFRYCHVIMHFPFHFPRRWDAAKLAFEWHIRCGGNMCCDSDHTSIWCEGSPSWQRSTCLT